MFLMHLHTSDQQVSQRVVSRALRITESLGSIDSKLLKTVRFSHHQRYTVVKVRSDSVSRGCNVIGLRDSADPR